MSQNVLISFPGFLQPVALFKVAEGLGAMKLMMVGLYSAALDKVTERG